METGVRGANGASPFMRRQMALDRGGRPGLSETCARFGIKNLSSGSDSQLRDSAGLSPASPRQVEEQCRPNGASQRPLYYVGPHRARRRADDGLGFNSQAGCAWPNATETDSSWPPLPGRAGGKRRDPPDPRPSIRCPFWPAGLSASRSAIAPLLPKAASDARTDVLNNKHALPMLPLRSQGMATETDNFARRPHTPG
jgi:hypothetical protein